MTAKLPEWTPAHDYSHYDAVDCTGRVWRL